MASLSAHRTIPNTQGRLLKIRRIDGMHTSHEGNDHLQEFVLLSFSFVIVHITVVVGWCGYLIGGCLIGGLVSGEIIIA